MNYLLIALDWAPNGTNDLIVYDKKRDKVIDCIPEALFGVNVYLKGLRKVTFGPYGILIKGHLKLEPEEYELFAHGAIVGESLVNAKLCVSPIDPNGDEPRKALNKYGYLLKEKK